MSFIFNQFKNYPLRSILLLAFVVRLFSAIFSQGYGMHDDHFLIIETSKSWTEGSDFNNWLPQNQLHPEATGHNLLYIGIHYLLFLLFGVSGIRDPWLQMFIIRLIHAVYSLLVVYYGYKITQKLSNDKTAFQVGMMLALLWFLPFMSVRNLVEIVSIPLLLAGAWILVKDYPEKRPLLQYLLAGFVMCIAVSIRYQTILFAGGAGLALLFERRFREAILFGLGSILSITLIQGGIDLYLWGIPFAEMKGYIVYNIKYQDIYGYNNYLMYFEVILGFLIPPLSLFLFFGFFKNWKKHLILFLPTFIFLAFHTYFPNKQERFIFTIIPFIVILGWIGWNDFLTKSVYWKNHPGFLKWTYRTFWIINLLVLPFISFSSSKLSRVNAMYSIYPEIDKTKAILIEDSEKRPAVMLPIYYAGKTVMTYTMERADIPTLGYSDNPGPYLKNINNLEFFTRNPLAIQPQFVIFTDGKMLNERIAAVKKFFPRLSFMKKVVPSNVDQLMKKLNPNNKNEVFYLYRTNQ